MKIIRKLIQKHKCWFLTAMLFTCLSVFVDLYWNSFVADIIDCLTNTCSLDFNGTETSMSGIWMMAVLIIFFNTACECLSSCLASYTCELFAHEMRMGYGRFYLQGDIKILSGMNAGEEQSAMQNELREISAYLNDNLFALVRQFVTFAATVVFLLCQNCKLTIFSVFLVVPLMMYCFFSGKIIKTYTEQCQIKKMQINGLTDTLIELFPVIWIYDAGKLIYTAIKERLFQWQNAGIQKEKTAAGLMSLSGVFSFLPLLLLLGFGGFMVIKGEISMGIFYIFINLSGNVSGFLQNMPNIYAGFGRFKASIHRLEKKLVLEEAKTCIHTQSV